MQPVKPIFGSFIIFVFLLHCLLPLIRSIGNRVSHTEGGMGHPPPSEKQPPPPHWNMKHPSMKWFLKKYNK